MAFTNGNSWEWFVGLLENDSDDRIDVRGGLIRKVAFTGTWEKQEGAFVMIEASKVEWCLDLLSCIICLTYA
jgi:hypothetical protein